MWKVMLNDVLNCRGQAIANSIRSSNPELAEQLGVGGFPFGNENNPHGGPSGDDNVPES